MKFIKRHFFPAFTFLMLIFFYACGNKENKKDSRTVFCYNEMGGLSSLDPAATSNFENIWAVNQLFNGLIQMSDSLKILPCIAKSWEISEDGLTYTFKLRNDVFFHDHEVFEGGKGRQVKARDFVFSFNRLYDPKVSSALSLLENINQDKGTNGFEAPDAETLIIHLKKPFSPFLGILTMKFFSVVPEEVVTKYKEDFRRNPVGTGPFKFKYWEEGTRLVMHKNEKYFEFENNQRLPYLDAVSVTFIREKEAAFMQFLKGDIDMLSGIDAFNPAEVLDADGKLKSFYQDKFYLQTQPYIKTDYIGILVDDSLPHVKNSPLKLKAIRKAINYAFDRDKLIKYFHNNIGYPANAGFIPKGLKSFQPKKVKGYYYSPEKVKKYLAEAGFPNGKGLPVITLHTTENYMDILEYIQGQLNENNIKLKINIQNSTVLKTGVAKNEFNMFKKSWIGDYADEENFMSLFYSKNFSPKGFNYTHYRNEEFDELFDQAQLEKNDSVKTTLYQKMDQLLIDDAPVIPLYYDQIIRLVRHNVSHLGNNPMNLLNLKQVKKVN
jgi:peptide/nickel transport system substrate-binding protein